MLKNYIGISRDHSVSMRHLRNAATDDYNSNVRSIKENASKYDQDTIVSVVENGRGVRGEVVKVITNSSVNSIKELSYNDYKIDGNATPLFDSVGALIEQFETVPDYNDPNVSFLIIAVTDGQDNNSPIWRSRIGDKIRQLQATDKWTFVFRVPRGGKYYIQNTGVHPGNIQQWEQTERGFHKSSQHIQTAYAGYYNSRALGKTSTDKFFVDTVQLNKKKIKKNLVDISSDVVILSPKKTEIGEQIRDYVERKMKRPYAKGEAYYLLTRTEKVQEYKKLCLLDKKTHTVYGGSDARDLLGLPETGLIKLVPGNINQYEVFVQSTSTNRLVRNKILVWRNGV
mgnify:CR=1 FL=1